MKKIAAALTALSVALYLPIAAHADPRADMKAFQNYFFKKFPGIKKDAYADGLYALPGAEDRPTEWQAIIDFPPLELAMESGKKFWQKHNLGSCFKNDGKGIAAGYPYWDKKSKEIRTIELDINECLKKKRLQPLNNGDLAAVTAYMKSMSNGKRIKIDLSDPGAIAAYERGKQFYWAKRGQLNLSCANCHIDNAGKFINGNILSAGLGHGLGFPAHRFKWEALGTIHRQYRNCNARVGAMPLEQDHKLYRAVELYEAYMNTGLPIKVPSRRF